MYNVALQANSCYNKHVKLFGTGDAGNIPMPELHLYERRANGYSIRMSSALQADPRCFPLLTSWRKVIMSHPRKGTPEYEEWKNSPAYAELRYKISAGKTGKKIKYAPRPKSSSARKGVPRNPETIAKMSAANKGVKWSEERKKAHAEAARKRVITPELRSQYSAAKKGKKSSIETRAKISAAHKGLIRSEEHKANLRKERRKEGSKYSQAQKDRYASLSEEEKGELNEKRLKAVRNKNTDIEAYVARQLDRNKVVYEQQKRIGRYLVDFLIPDQHHIVEVNGCWWHGCEKCGYSTPEHLKKREHDNKRIAFLMERGYTVTILWQHDLYPLMNAEKRE